MMEPDEFVSWWEEDNLVRFSPAAFDTLNIPEESKRFLIEAGLPDWTRLKITFWEDEQPLPTIVGFLQEERQLPPECSRYRVIGDYYGAFICLDEQDNGRVIGIEVDYEEPLAYFINSSVAQMAECLIAYRALPYGLDARGLSAERMREFVNLLKEDFERIDPNMLDRDDSWWGLVVEDLELYL